MKKYLSFGIVIVLLALVAVGCGGNAPAAAPTTAPAAQATSAPAATSATTGGTTPAATTAAGPTTSAGGTATAPASGTSAPGSFSGTAPTMKNPDTFVSVEYGEPESLDPAWDYETAGSEVLQNVYEPLVTMNREKVDQFIPLLAEKYTTSSDGKTWTFNIRKNVKFHNGDTLTASDVAYSYIRGFIQSQASGPQWIMLQPFFGPSVTFGFMDPNAKPGDKTGDDVVNAQYNGDFTAACNAAKKLIVADDNAMTVTMTLKQPWGPFLASIAGPWGSIVDQKWAAAQGDWNGDCATAKQFNNPEANASKLFDKTNGTGPYMLATWDKGNQITLDANPNYWVTTPLWPGGPSGAPSLKHIVIKNVSEWGTRFSMLQTGDADWAVVDSNFYSQADPLVKQDCDPTDSTKCTPVGNGFLTRLKPLTGLQQDTIFINQNVNATGGNNFLGSGKLDGNGIPPDFFKDIHIRKALQACFDYDTFIKQVRQGLGIVPNGPVIPGELGYNKNDPTPKYDQNTCKSEFDAAAKDPGYENLSKGFFVQFVYNTGNANRQAAGQILAADVKKVNPKFIISVVDEPWPVFLKDDNSGRVPLAMLGWLEDYHDPNDWVAPYLGSGGNYSANQGFDPTLQKQMDQLINQAVSETDATKRGQIYSQLNKIAVDNALDVFIDTPIGQRYLQPWVKGAYYNPILATWYYYALSKSQ